MSMHAAATEILEHADWDFAAVYYDAIDHFCHGFMQFHPPRLPWVDEESFELYQHVVANAYRYHDVMLGRLLQLAGPDATVILLSDHGFHPDGLRPGYIPAEAAGPAVEHRAFGMIVLAGPGISRGETIYGSSLLDIAPTILHVFGLAVGQDMDGKVLVTALERPGKIEFIPTWDEVEGDAGTHPAGEQLDATESVEVMKQMVALGYVAPPGPDAAKNVAACLDEHRYNLARAHDDAGRPDQSLPLYRTLHAADRGDQRYVQRLVEALQETGDRTAARSVLDAFDEFCQTNAPQSKAELKRRREAKADGALNGVRDAADQREIFERRKLAERASGFPMLRLALRLRLDLADGRSEEARQGVAILAERFGDDGAPALLLAGACAQLDDDEAAQAWIDRALKSDRDDWQALALSARIHLRNRRFAAALDAAAASLALIYFQPFTHYLLGRALAARGEYDDAERAFKVASKQSPGMAVVYEALGRLCRRQGRHGEALMYQNRAAELRERAKKRCQNTPAGPLPSPADLAPLPQRDGLQPAEPQHDVVVVAGLPRSGTSMLMQLLAAGGVTPLTDGARAADSDNPRGYFEFQPATDLAADASWLPQARGKAVKLALPLVMQLPPGEPYRLIVIERDPQEVIASQRAMLERLGRAGEGAALDDDRLAAAYYRQRERLRLWLERRKEVAVLPLRYAAVLSDPQGTADRIAVFLGREFAVAAAARAVDPALQRQQFGVR
jgi:tetratricopeptide (TPR) repeat protein